jgi:site-specific DNA recombinase
MKPESREALLAAIAKARGSLNQQRLHRHIVAGVVHRHERHEIGGSRGAGRAERDSERRALRLMAPLAFLSPRIIAAIVDGTAPADLTVTGLAKALPYSWAEQERRVGLHL